MISVTKVAKEWGDKAAYCLCRRNTFDKLRLLLVLGVSSRQLVEEKPESVGSNSYLNEGQQGAAEVKGRFSKRNERSSGRDVEIKDGKV